MIPAFFFDREGRLWYTGNFISEEALYEGHHGIYLVELDRESFQIIGERKILWDGKTTRSKWIEAPHLYQAGDWYYLMAAEGGTFTNHSVVMARSKRIDGNYEPCPRNPILTHRHLPLTHPISVTGHGDLVCTQNGEWYMVLLAVRPYQESHFNLGRETFLIPMTWAPDGWLMADTQGGLVHEQERAPKLPWFHAKPQFYSDNFESPMLGLCWNSIHPIPSRFYSLTQRPGCLRLFLQPAPLQDISTPGFLGRRQQHRDFRCIAAMDFTPAAPWEEAGLALVQDDRFHYTFTLGMEKGAGTLQVKKTQDARNFLLTKTKIPLGKRLYLTICGDERGYHFYYGFHEQEKIPLLLEGDPTVLSSVTNAGFTGTYIGMYATSQRRATENHADFDWFIYEGLQHTAPSQAAAANQDHSASGG